MPNRWMNHVRQFRKQNRHLSYKQLLQEAKKSYGGNPMPMKSRKRGGALPPMLMNSLKKGGGVMGYETPSVLTRSATRIGGADMMNIPKNLAAQANSAMTSTSKNMSDMMKKLGGKTRRRRR
jgi:hypothetical protein